MQMKNEFRNAFVFLCASVVPIRSLMNTSPAEPRNPLYLLLLVVGPGVRR